MNVILLSGGSGKRLWPLSNDIRSKQFIKIFKNDSGEYESMVQGMYRRIKRLDPDAKITIATSKSQVSELRNQLGDDVAVSVEPTRRDTFPAIAIAVAYLNEIQGVSEEEPVIVCPIDPYVEDSYFLALQKLEQLIQKGESNICLMGKEPDSPSEKYGYIIPESHAEISRVSCFKEKPTTAKAEEYIKQGALWNMGIFGFKLGYIKELSKNIFKYKDYADLFDRYAEMTKISFDYAVLEKEKSIQVMRFDGRWDDLGTWEALVDVMEGDSFGKALVRDCHNTKVVNELDIPVASLGLNDIIVAASSEGILVASKKSSSSIKPIAEMLESEEGVRYAEKSWGKYQVIDVGADYLTISIELKAGHRMSYHSHANRNEVWTIVSGSGMTVVDGMSQHVHPGDVITMEAGCRHTIIADEDLKVIEVQLGKEISVSDKKKFPYE